ncbi:hypothetical protein SNEBB_000349 [Seison nebaliae]|nr:hypothetical protein SNEBB_000349 [Seison nebaliae]
MSEPQEYPLLDLFNKIVLMIGPPVTTIPSQSMRDIHLDDLRTIYYKRLTGNDDAPYCQEKYSIPSILIDNIPPMKNCNRIDLKDKKKIVNFFFNIPQVDNRRYGALFRERSRIKQERVWNKYCKNKFIDKQGPELVVPKNDFTKKAAPAYSMRRLPKYNLNDLSTPGPFHYDIKREPMSDKGWSFQRCRTNKQINKPAESYNSTQYKAIGTDGKKFSFGRKLNEIHKKEVGSKFYYPKEFSTRKISFGLKTKAKPKKDNAEFCCPVSNDVTKNRAPVYEIIGKRHSDTNSGIDTSPGTLLPKLTNKRNFPKYSMVFVPERVRHNRFGDIENYIYHPTGFECSPGPAFYNVNLSTNEFRAHLFNFRHNGRNKIDETPNSN